MGRWKNALKLSLLLQPKVYGDKSPLSPHVPPGQFLWRKRSTLNCWYVFSSSIIITFLNHRGQVLSFLTTAKIQRDFWVLIFFNTNARLSGKIGPSCFCTVVMPRVSVQGVKSLWGDCMFIPADWGSQ